ncbi:sugar ABC transporter permease [Lachnoclostridium phytofermentans]|jgi:arabinogalactan oligomer/maltooligosaccharide transport system permease protein|uniref:sugar ABC transporter permease n=1 Tax=Lachnoclostridium phytofermentans TaxID=66219 RepID=UPI000AA62DF4|nr:sugar ABC transporter permease [Lachnoclostridium phytofermentans]
MMVKKETKMKHNRSMRKRKLLTNTFVHILLSVLAIIWILPIVWVIITSFKGDGTGPYTGQFLPTKFTLDNYIRLFKENDLFYFGRWFMNTLVVAIFSCIISTFYVLCISYSLSRTRFKGRKTMMNFGLILNMFPGFMSMIAVYYILKGIGITQSLIALILVYSGGAGLGYYIAKGFFDTIPKAIDEAAQIDGATKWSVFTKITMPLSKPIIVYTILTSFLAPWLDFIFAKVIMGDKYENYTVSIGLWTMLEKEFIQNWYTRFAAGAVCVSIPIALLFIVMQKYYTDGLSGSVKG